MKNHRQAGFALLEIAIFLIVIGIVMGAALPSIMRYRQLAQIKEARERQEIILQAVAGYALARGHLPCPADPSIPLTQRGNQREACRTLEESIGIVPYHALGLPESAARDAYHRYMTYAVPGHSHIGTEIADGGGHKVCKMERMPHPINLLDRHNQPLDRDNHIYDFVAVVLISHGPSGHGAFTGQGSTKLHVAEVGREEQINGDATLTFYDLPFRLEGAPFRHIVKGVTRNNLMSIYGRNPCTAETLNVRPSQGQAQQIPGRPIEQNNPRESRGDAFPDID